MIQIFYGFDELICDSWSGSLYFKFGRKNKTCICTRAVILMSWLDHSIYIITHWAYAPKIIFMFTGSTSYQSHDIVCVWDAHFQVKSKKKTKTHLKDGEKDNKKIFYIIFVQYPPSPHSPFLEERFGQICLTIWYNKTHWLYAPKYFIPSSDNVRLRGKKILHDKKTFVWIHIIITEKKNLYKIYDQQ